MRDSRIFTRSRSSIGLHHTGYGIDVNHIGNGRLDKLWWMPLNLKQILWHNVRALMTARWGEENLQRLARDGEIGAASAQRIKDQKTAVGLDVLAGAADALKVPAYQLLIPEEDRDYIVRVLTARVETDDRGRMGIELALEAAELRSNERRRGMGRTDTTDSG